MSRIGNRKINIPEGVTVNIENNIVTVNGSKGTLSYEFDSVIDVKQEDNQIVCTRKNESKISTRNC